MKMKIIAGVLLVFFMSILTFSSVHAITGDVNGDGKVDTKDLALLVKAFGAFPSDPRWNASYDLDKNGRIDMRDLVIVVQNFGKT
jgi:hypothetical protein